MAVSSMQLFTVVATASYVMRLEVARGYVAIALPAGMIGLLLSGGSGASGSPCNGPRARWWDWSWWPVAPIIW